MHFIHLLHLEASLAHLPDGDQSECVLTTGVLARKQFSPVATFGGRFLEVYRPVYCQNIPLSFHASPDPMSPADQRIPPISQWQACTACTSDRGAYPVSLQVRWRLPCQCTAWPSLASDCPLTIMHPACRHGHLSWYYDICNLTFL